MTDQELVDRFAEHLRSLVRCDVQEDSVRGDIGGPCRKLRGHDGDHDPFERIVPDAIRESMGLPAR